MLRYLILFAGIVLMINGCNGLFSGRFGTHRLRQMTTAEAEAGIGDSDYIEITDAEYAGEVVFASEETGKRTYFFRPLRSASGRYRLVAWSKYGEPMELNAPVIGLVGAPESSRLPVKDRAEAEKNNFAEDVRYIQVGEQPLAWYWYLLMFLGGIGIALLSEAYYFRRSPNQPEPT